MEAVSTIRPVLSIMFVFALLGLAFWKLPRRGNPATFRLPLRRTTVSPRAIESLERLALTPQHALHLIRVQGREMVVATHPQGCTLLGEAYRSVEA